MEEKKLKKIEKEFAIQERKESDHEEREKIRKKKAANLAKQLKYH